MVTRELVSLRERRAAAALCLSWGYPRPITWLEIARGRWWASALGVGWLIEGASEGELHLHGIGRPGVRSVLSREWTADVLSTARKLRAKRVCAPLFGTNPALERLLRRAGWDKSDGLGPYLEVQ